MQPQTPSTTDKSDTELWLARFQFKLLVLRIGRDSIGIRTFHVVLMNAAMIAFVSRTIWRWWGLVSVVMSLVFVFVFVLEFAAFLALRNIDKKQPVAERLISFMENTQDSGLLGTILDLYEAAERLGDEWQAVTNAAFTTAMRLLPLLQSSDTYHLNTLNRVLLRQVMFLPDTVQRKDHWVGLEYCLSALYALEQIGDKRDLPDVQRLLKADYITDEIRVAAEFCVQVIWERVAHEEGKDFLLRADRKPENGETLLRPAVENADTPPEQLLRAAPPDTHDPPA